MNEKKPISRGREQVTPLHAGHIVAYVMDRAEVETVFERVIPEARRVRASIVECSEATRKNEYYHSASIMFHSDHSHAPFIALEIPDLVPDRPGDTLYSPAFTLDEPERALLEMTHAVVKSKPLGSDINSSGFGRVLSVGEYGKSPLYILEHYEKQDYGPMMTWYVSNVPTYDLHPSYYPARDKEKQAFITTNQQQELEERLLSSVGAHDASLDYINSLPQAHQRRVMDLLREKPEIVEEPEVLRTWVRGRMAA